MQRIILTINKLKNAVSSWLDIHLETPADSPETKALKIRFTRYLIAGIPFLILTGLILWITGLTHVSIVMNLFALFELVLFVSLILHRKHVNIFVVTNQFFYVLFSFAAVLYFGGIMYSGGVVLVGLAGVLHSLYFLKPSQIHILFMVYIITVITEAILQPHLVKLPEITPTANLILFVLHLFVIAIVFKSWLNFFIKQSMLLKTKEVEHLKEIDTIKTDFYTQVTREFRTPLTIILGYSNPAAKLSISDFQQKISIIHKNGIRLLHLVDKMLNLSRLEANAMQLNFIQSDILSYIRQLVDIIKHMAKGKSIKLHYQSPLKELKIDFDPDKIDSLLSNLISNAIKYSPENTDVYIVVSTLQSYRKQQFGYCVFPERENNNQRHLKITVKDGGVGITESELPLIFNRFYQGESNNRHQSYGAGIGLFIVKELVDLLDGNLFVSSKPNIGTEITVLLPISDKIAISNPFDSKEHVKKNKLTKNEIDTDLTYDKKELPLLLIIEDNNDIVNYLKFITIKNFRIIRAEHGTQGIEMALKTIPDVIILDVLMPEKNELKVCETLKNDFRTSHIPIIILSAKVDKPSQVLGYKHGADAYITMPFDQQELSVRLQKLIEVRENLKAKYKTLALFSDAPNENIQDPDEQFLLKTKKIIDDYFSDDSFSVVKLSSLLAMSRSQLFRKLKALTGLSATQFIRFYRLSVAKNRIQETNLTISEIAYEVGFKDPAYFSRVFTDEFGAPPSYWRNHQH
ncbi:hybrid sensor histidine kinase/response regulator transcription factor [Sunxiuqinia sp. sy24]|uniref:hybrid sensor histidine kinase/response regulator transcription factor n=1 Tax=Sunxiuqinia sp. sy24 TaxID=3461495 RepID=UPI0040457B6F